METLIQEIINEMKKTDTSFMEKGIFGFTPKYTQSEMRETWFNGIAFGLEEGMRTSSPTGQRIQLQNSAILPRQKEFIEKFYKLCGEYNCVVIYHPQEGMKIRDLASLVKG